MRLRLRIRAARRLLPSPQRGLLPARPAGPADRHRPWCSRAHRAGRPRRDRAAGRRRAAARVRERRRPHRDRARVGRAGARQVRGGARRGRSARVRQGRHLPSLRRGRRPPPRPDTAMTSRTRNLSILGVVAALLVAAALVILSGTPLSKDTKLGLDLEGGIELVYEGRPTPQVPEVTPQAVDDAIETMRKRVDSLGVSEPEIQRSGPRQISVGLPDVTNAERAREQVGTTAQLQFYDWEPNILTDTEVYSGGDGLYEATLAASKLNGKAERTDVVPGSGDTREEADRNNNTQADRYYLFGPDE